MSAGALIDWRRWVAILCAILVSALSIPSAHADSFVSAQASIEIGADNAHGHQDHNDNHHRGEPEHDGSEPHSHHCSSAHAASVPCADTHLNASRTALSVAFAHSSSWPAAGPIYGLERPPRPIA